MINITRRGAMSTRNEERHLRQQAKMMMSGHSSQAVIIYFRDNVI